LVKPPNKSAFNKIPKWPNKSKIPNKLTPKGIICQSLFLKFQLNVALNPQTSFLSSSFSLFFNTQSLEAVLALFELLLIVEMESLQFFQLLHLPQSG